MERTPPRRGKSEWTCYRYGRLTKTERRGEEGEGVRQSRGKDLESHPAHLEVYLRPVVCVSLRVLTIKRIVHDMLLTYHCYYYV